MAVVGKVEDEVVEHRVPRVLWGGRERLVGLEASRPPVWARAGDEIDVAALEGVVLDVCVDDLVDGEGLELRVAEDDGWGGLVGCVGGEKDSGA